MFRIKNLFPISLSICLFFQFQCLSQAAASSKTYYVDGAAAPNGDGSFSNPFQTMNQGTASAQAGDTVNVRAGTYPELIVFPQGGNSETERIILKAYASEIVIVSNAGRCLDVDQPYITVENIIFWVA